MIIRNVLGALRLNSRVLSAVVSSNRSSACSQEPQGATCEAAALDVLRKACQPRTHVSKCNSVNPTAPSSGVDFLYEAIGLTSDRELVSRLAKVWAITPEVLCSTADALADLLEPCGRDTTAHALWMLVRCPSLRYWSAQQLRSSFRQLKQLTKNAQLSDCDFTQAVYRHPWMLNAAAATAVVRRTPAGAAGAAQVPVSSQQAGTHSSPAPQQQQQPLPIAAAHKRVAILLVQAQAYSTRVSGSSSDAPPYVSPVLAEAAVKAYIAMVEAPHVLAEVAQSAGTRFIQAAAGPYWQQQQEEEEQEEEGEEPREQSRATFDYGSANDVAMQEDMGRLWMTYVEQSHK